LIAAANRITDLPVGVAAEPPLPEFDEVPRPELGGIKKNFVLMHKRNVM
jgi:hypothetical protein